MMESTCERCNFIGSFVGMGHEERHEQGMPWNVDVYYSECPACGAGYAEEIEDLPTCPECKTQAHEDHVNYRDYVTEYNDYYKRDFTVDRYDCHCQKCGHDWLYRFVDPEQWGG